MSSSNTLEITCSHAETGESYVFHFSPSERVLDALKQQASEYTRVNPKSMILLSATPPHQRVDNKTLLVDLNEVFLYDRDSLSSRTRQAGSIGESDLDDLINLIQARRHDPEAVVEACEACANRCRVQLRAARAAVVNLVEHTNIIAGTFRRFQITLAEITQRHGQFLASFEQSLSRLGQVKAITGRGGSLLDALAERVEVWKRGVNEVDRQRLLIADKARELDTLFVLVESGAKSEAGEDLDVQAIDTLEKELKRDGGDFLLNVVRKFKAMEMSCAKSLFARLRAVSSLQKKIQDLSNKIAALKEGIQAQDSLVQQLDIVKRIPEAYEAAIAEAQRRRIFVEKYTARVQALADFVARERDSELERRDAFKRAHGRFLPDELVPGLVPGLFPPCEVNQREIDADLAKSMMVVVSSGGVVAPIITPTPPVAPEDEIASSEDGPVIMSRQPATSMDHFGIGSNHNIDPFEVLMLRAQVERLQGGEDNNHTQTLKHAFEMELEGYKNRIVELEQALDKAKSASSQQHESSTDVGVDLE